MKIPFNTVNAVIAAAVLVSLPVSCKEARSDETWMVATVRSYHYERGVSGRCEDNYGLGIEHHIGSDYSLSAGEYKNSFCDRSYYVGGGWFPIHQGNWHFGTNLGVVTGYERHDPAGFLVLGATYQAKDWGVNIGVVPSRDRPFTVIGLQVKRKF